MRSVLCVFLVLPALLFGAATAGAQQAPAEPAAAEATPARKWVPAFLRNYENPKPRAVLPGTQETAAVSREPAADAPKAKAKPSAEAASAKKKSVKKKKKAKKKVAKKKKKAVKPKDEKPEVEPETVRAGSHDVAAFESEQPDRQRPNEVLGGRGSVSFAIPPVIEPPLTGTPIDTLALYKQAMSSGDITGALALFRQTVNTPPDINLVAKLNGLMGVSLSSDQASELVEEVAEFAAVQPPRPASAEAARIHGVHDMIADAAAPSLVVALEHYKSAVVAGDQLAAMQSLTRVLGRPVDDEAARQADVLLNIPASAGLAAQKQAAAGSGG